VLGQIPGPKLWAESLVLVVPQLWFSFGAFLALLAIVSRAAPGAVQHFLRTVQRTPMGPERTPGLLTLAMLVVIAPIAEELLFRGLVFNSLAARWGLRRATVVVALIFGLFHANAPAMFVFGLVLTVIYIKTRSLLVPMACHALNNLIPALLLFERAQRGLPAAQNDSPAGLRAAALPALAITALFGGMLVLYLAHNWPRRDATLPYDDGVAAGVAVAP
jgi:membrane protease YdiL (CAAX protease family)